MKIILMYGVIIGTAYSLWTVFSQIYEGGMGRNGSTMAVRMIIMFRLFWGEAKPQGGTPKVLCCEDALWKISIKLLRGTNLGVAQVDFKP